MTTDKTRFPDFHAFWHPFTLGAGPAPDFVQSLPDDRRQKLKEHLADSLGSDGEIVLSARAWAVKSRWAAEGG